jgi:hypothetical protein
MAQCRYCQSETELYDRNIPICKKCSDERESKRPSLETAEQVRRRLIQDNLDAIARTNEALRLFNGVMDQFPSGLPHPDGTQRIQNASRKLIAARKERERAHKRLNDFIEHGVVPEDLKR